VISTKITEEILEKAKKIYSEGNSVKGTANILQEKLKVKINTEVLRRKLKKLGIIRDNSLCQKLVKRKHLSIENIIRLYKDELISLRKLAKTFKSNKKTIHKILEENGIKIRNNDESNRIANTKHSKFPFSGDECDKAYMIGLIKGDITLFIKSKFTLRLTSSSSRKAFVDLFKNTFEEYGPIYIYVAKNGLSRYNWKMTAELDLNSFNFLLTSQTSSNKQFIFNYLAGLIDSDGSIFIRKAGKYFQYILRIYNEDLPLLKTIRKFLEREEFSPSLQLFSKKGDTRKSKVKTVKYNNDYYAIELSQRENVAKLLSLVLLRHSEKLLWKNKIEEIEKNKLKFWGNIEKEVKNLRKYINIKYQEGLIEAEKIFKKKYNNKFITLS